MITRRYPFRLIETDNIGVNKMQLTMTKLPLTQMLMWSFIGFSVCQLLIFIFLPHWFDEFVPGVDTKPLYPFMRLIGIKEIGLMLVYASAAYTNDRKMIVISIIGRLSLTPVSLFLVYGVGAPTNLMFAAIQDGIFALSTLYALRIQAGYKSRKLISTQATWTENTLRCCLFIAGMAEILHGVTMMTSPTEMFLINRIVSIDLQVPPLFIATRGLGFMTAVVGYYEVYFSISRIPLLSYACTGLLHVIYFVGGSNMAHFFGLPSFTKKINIPFYHALMGVFLLIQSVAVYTGSQGDGIKNEMVKKRAS